MLKEITVLEEWGRARRHCLFTLTMQLAFWRQLPWIMYGAARHEGPVAIDCARRSLALYEVASNEVKQHPQVAAMLAPGSVGREQCLLFVSGQSLSTQQPSWKGWGPTKEAPAHWSGWGPNGGHGAYGGP